MMTYPDPIALRKGIQSQFDDALPGARTMTVYATPEGDLVNVMAWHRIPGHDKLTILTHQKLGWIQGIQEWALYGDLVLGRVYANQDPPVETPALYDEAALDVMFKHPDCYVTWRIVAGDEGKELEGWWVTEPTNVPVAFYPLNGEAVEFPYGMPFFDTLAAVWDAQK